MTVQSVEPNFNSYTGDGVQDTYAYTFRLDDTDWLKVKVDGALTTAFTLDTVATNIVFLAGNIPPLDSIVLLYSDIPATQLVNYTPYGPFPAEATEEALDKLTLLIQEGREDSLSSSINMNYIDNPMFSVNQRSFAGGTLEPGEYGYDRWRASDSGQCFVGKSENKIIVSGGELQQDVPNFKADGRTATISWAGNGQVNGNTSPFQITLAPGNTTLLLTNGTFENIKLEVGGIQTAFEYVKYDTEFIKCMRYYQRITGSALCNSPLQAGVPAGKYTVSIPTFVKMRRIPDLELVTHTLVSSGNSVARPDIPDYFEDGGSTPSTVRLTGIADASATGDGYNEIEFDIFVSTDIV